MKIGDSRPVGGTVRTTGATPARKAGGSAALGGIGAVSDSASIMGIPESEFTPRVRDAIMMLLKEVDSLRQELGRSKAQIQQLEKLADQDALAPVANRRAFVRELSRMLSFAQRYDSNISVLYFDINDMKRINDTYGHSAGDAAITHVAGTLTGNVRESDIVGRLGGDEFGVILANAGEAAARAKAESLARNISDTPFEWNGDRINIEITFGAYSLKGGDDASAMIDQADRAMYARKPRESERTS